MIEPDRSQQVYHVSATLFVSLPFCTNLAMEHRIMWRVYSSVIDMLKIRGFSSDVVLNEADFYDRITIHYTDELRGIAETFDKGILNCSMTRGDETVLVVFTNETTIGKKHVTELVDGMGLSNVEHCVLIYGNSLTSSAKKDIERQKLRIEAFSESEVLYNLMNHTLMPKYTVLTKSEKKSLFGEKCLITESQLPRISSSDRSARYLGLRRGDVVRIERKSQTVGTTVLYRVCV